MAAPRSASNRQSSSQRQCARQSRENNLTRKPAVAAKTEAAKSAKIVGLRYVTDTMPGIERVRAGTSFRYRRTHGGRFVRDAATLKRIRSLAIPPAWTNVWICLSAIGHLQATGRDAKGRKQYRYHPRWSAIRDENKYHRMIAFGRSLPRLRRRIAKDLRRPRLVREKVLAAVVGLLERTLIRVGNDEYARENNSFGLTTLRDRHARVAGATILFEFRGKGGARHRVRVTDQRLAQIVKRCRDLPGYELFQYENGDGTLHTISSGDVNDYLRIATGQDFTAKDFRTWAGTVLAVRAMRDLDPVESQTQAKRNVVRAVEQVAGNLGNTRAVCRKCYIHPAVVDAYLDGSLIRATGNGRSHPNRHARNSMAKDEAAVLHFLQRQRKRPDQRRIASGPLKP